MSAPQETLDTGNPLDCIARGLFFIVGCARSGTSLLQVMIASHPEITLPSETGFFSLLQPRYAKRYGGLETAETFRQAFDATMASTRIRALELDNQRVWELCQRGAHSWNTLFLAILAAFAEQHAARRVGEKSPRHVEYMVDLSTRFPQAKFLHIIRDPRAVALSYSRAAFGSQLIGDACHRWKAAIEAHDHAISHLGSQYTWIRYEDLVTEPERTLRQCCRFLGCKFNSRMLEFHNREQPGFANNQQAHMSSTLSPLFTSSINQWRRELSSGQIAMVEHVLGPYMQRFDYPLTGATSVLTGLRYRSSLLLGGLIRAARWPRRSLG